MRLRMFILQNGSSLQREHHRYFTRLLWTQAEMKFRITILIIFLSILTQTRTFSHPHVFIHNAVTFVFDDKGLAGFKVNWVFDEMFSNMMIHDYDKNKNLKFEVSEIKKLKKGAFSNLKNFEYFSYVKINGRPFKVRFVKDFSAKIIKNRIIYQFLVPCHVKAASSFKRINMSVHDKTFYCSVFLVKDQIFFENDSSYDYDYRIEKNTKEAFYYGQIYPEEIILRFRLKDG